MNRDRLTRRWKSSTSKKNRLKSFGGLTFFKDYTNNFVTADYSVGSPTGTFTRSACDCTYVDGNGVLQKVTAANIPRFQGGYYDATGFHVQSGLMIEAAATNLLIRTDGTASGSGKWTGWLEALGTINGTEVYTQVAIPELTAISGAYAQRIQYTGVAADDGTPDILFYNTTSTAVGSVTQGDKVTVSAWLKGSSTNVIVEFVILERDAGDNYLTSQGSSALQSSISSTEWRRFSHTFTVGHAGCSRVNFAVRARDFAEGDTVDMHIYGAQAEASPYATSWIPTAAAAATRNAETLTYLTASNRTAATESVFIKFAPESAFANDGVYRLLTTTDTKQRFIGKADTGTSIIGYPNLTDDIACGTVCSTTPAANTSYVYAMIAKAAGTQGMTGYLDGTNEGGSDAATYTSNAWGTKFWIGSSNGGIYQLNGIIQKIALFSDVKDTTEVGTITDILNS